MTIAEGVQLAVHDVPRQDPLQRTVHLGDGLHPGFRHRRTNGRACSQCPGGFRRAQQPVLGRPLPQRHHQCEGAQQQL